MNQYKKDEAQRLESLWGGDFGDEYVERNTEHWQVRGDFWHNIIDTYGIDSVLEVGCNLGGNLRWFRDRLEDHDIYGVDINKKALATLHDAYPDINTLYSPARHLPFRDQFFDMVFTFGVLIHQPDETLPVVMSEIYRTARRYIVCGEYHAETRTEVPYRGHDGALIKRDFGAIYQAMYPELQLRDTGFLSKEEGWDDITYWVFEK